MTPPQQALVTAMQAWHRKQDRSWYAKWARAAQGKRMDGVALYCRYNVAQYLYGSVRTNIDQPLHGALPPCDGVRLSFLPAEPLPTNLYTLVIAGPRPYPPIPYIVIGLSIIDPRTGLGYGSIWEGVDFSIMAQFPAGVRFEARVKWVAPQYRPGPETRLYYGH
jgi:hypothetical protein